MKRLVYLSVLLTFPALLACGSEREVLGGLDSRQSIESVVVLSRSGIAAEREKISSGRNERYRVLVSSRDYPRALAVIHEYRLPRNEDQDIEAFTSPQGFTPNSQEISHLRLDYALGLEIERLLSALPGVVDAKVLVRSRLRKDDSLGRGLASPGASVVLRYVAPSGKLPFSDEEVKQIITRAVPGINPASIRVNASRVVIPGGHMLFPSGQAYSEEQGTLVKLSPLLRFRVHEGDRLGALKQIFAYLLAFCVAGLAIGFRWGSYMTRRGLLKKGKRKSSGVKTKNFFLEATFGDEGSGDTGRFPRPKDPSDSLSGR